jgi:hypothetical protein
LQDKASIAANAATVRCLERGVKKTPDYPSVSIPDTQQVQTATSRWMEVKVSEKNVVQFHAWFEPAGISWRATAAEECRRRR